MAEIEPQPKPSMWSRAVECIGWMGTLFVLVGYILASLGIINSQQVIYHVVVLIGCAGIVTVTAYRRVYQPFIINAIVGVFAIIAIVRLTCLVHH